MTSIVSPLEESPTLTVLVPVFNEAGTVGKVLQRLVENLTIDKEILVVDDGSTDATPAILTKWAGVPGVAVFQHSQNRGKGAAIHTGLAHARGKFTIIQDADMEYDPRDIPHVLAPLLHGEADVAYGSRYAAPDKSLPWSKFRIAVVLLNTLVRILYGRQLTDVATCYKAFPTDLLRALALRSNRFDICLEMTAKVCRLGLRVVEVPISYKPRSKAEGKKIGWRDAGQGVWTLLRWRWMDWVRDDDRRHERSQKRDAGAPALPGDSGPVLVTEFPTRVNEQLFAHIRE
jgi:glycosyltransferase involved in cell wall biosynthesis